MENEDKRISSYIRDILSGRPIAEIPKRLILKVHETFNKNKSKYNISNSKYVQIIHEFENIEKRFKLIKKETQIITNNQIKPSRYNKSNSEKIDKSHENDNEANERSEIKAIVEELINGASFDIIETESIDQIIDYCKQTIDQLVKKSELNSASAYQNLLDDMIQLSYERKYLSLIMTKKEGMSNQISFFEQQINDEAKKIQEENEKIDQETFYLLQMEEEEWAKFLLQFDTETDQGPPPKFLKLSAKLLNLKQVEKFLIKSKRFSEASKIHEISSQLEEKELNNQRQLYIDERKNKKDQLMILHQSRIQSIQSYAERKKSAIGKKSQNAIDSFNNAIKNILIKEKDINNLINEEKKVQNDEIKSDLQTNKNVSHVKKKKRKTSPKNKKIEKNVKRVHFDESIFQ